MKSKATTYLLALAVAVVWGLIIYRVVDAYSADDDAPVITPATVVNKEPMDDYSPVQDTTRLQLNYRDPFEEKLAAALKDTLKERPVRQVLDQAMRQAASVKLQKPAINWAFISYTGYVRNPSTKKLLALVHINGKELMLSEGESAEQIKLLRNRQDSIQIAYQGQTKYIVMTTTSL